MLLETANAFEFDSLHQLISTSSSILFIERLFDWVIRFLQRFVIFQEFDSAVKSLGDSSLLVEYTWIMMAGSKDKLIVFLAQMLRQILLGGFCSQELKHPHKNISGH